MNTAYLLKQAEDGLILGDQEIHHLANHASQSCLLSSASHLRDQGHGNLFSFSKKVFIPLTQLCRDVCHYCTFAQVPRKLDTPYLTPEQVLAIAKQGAQANCKEALFTLGDQPEQRYTVAKQWLREHGYDSTLDYLAEMAQMVFQQTGLLPHLNPGLMNKDQLEKLKSVSVSMGIMLETAAPRLCQKGMPHYGSPDKEPSRRIETIRLAGEAAIPFTSGILIGIGETRKERIDSLLVLRQLHQQYGHIQEIIIQNFRAKPGTLMAKAEEPDLNELLWTLAMARIIFGAKMNIQAPPNLSPEAFPQLIQAGINDWGGVSPITPDFVNPEAPWPHLQKLADDTAAAGKHLLERLAIYPDYALKVSQWTAPNVSSSVLRLIDGQGFARTDSWSAGLSPTPPQDDVNKIVNLPRGSTNKKLKLILENLEHSSDHEISEQEIVTLLQARGTDFTQLCQAADRLRKKVNGDSVSYVVNRNINYTNICYFKCQFCAFSKGKTSANLRGRPYDLSADEIQRRTKEAWHRGATEVCLQGGIHPEYNGHTYLNICHTIKEVCPEIHIHAFSPLEVWQGAATLNLSLHDYLLQLKSAGLDTLPGTAAEILDDEVRATLCPDKITSEQWLEVMASAHKVGFKTTATIMFGHMEEYQHLARHLLRIKNLQKQSQGFTEFVPLPFIHMEAPNYRKGKTRKGPSFREAVALHAVARLVLHPHIKNIQASWTKLGMAGAKACLQAGANDLGGTLMNETITRAAGASHGQESNPKEMEKIIKSIGRTALQRRTNYQAAPETQRIKSFSAKPLQTTKYNAASKYERQTNTQKRSQLGTRLEVINSNEEILEQMEII